jgi:phospholipid/cholesterol/gamma-HCH transport system ATP-binding protein
MSQGATNSTGAAVRTGPRGAAPEAPEQTPPLIRLIDVHKSFGPQHVLSGVTLDLPTAQTTVVLGPSGTGKSVMLKLIVGLLKPDRGEIWFDGQRIDNLKERDLAAVRLQIGLLFQMGALFDSMTVEQNIAFPLDEHLKLSDSERTQKIARALDMVDMAGVQKKLPSQLSGGQRKRIALARAVVIEPRVVLYDEPTTGLDPVRSDGINELVIKLKKTLGVTSLVVTHDLTSARKVADRVIMLYGGKVIADGTFDQLQNHDDERVRHFFKGEYAADFDRSDMDKPDTKADPETRE